MTFFDRYNETTVTYISDLSRYWGGPRRGGWEAISHLGEVREFDTLGAANAWRVAQCV
jgi:hypothetical protein